MRKIATTAIAVLALSCGAAFAQSGSITIPGLAAGKGSAGSEVFNSRISVTNNKASDITAGGGKASVKIADVTLDGAANVNSVNITGSKIHNSDITISGNEAKNVMAIGGTANVNSVNIN